MRIPVLLLLMAAVVCARERTLTILATTDLHGNIYPYDYLTGKPAARGLAKLATLIRAERAEAPGALLLDCGDTIQGTPLEAVHQHYVSTGKLPLGLEFKGEPFGADPMMAAMNHLRYDAMVTGNHEFNHGLRNLDRARSDARFPWLSANTRATANRGRRPFEAFRLKEVDGVKVAIVGITTPAVPTWEKPENYAGYTFEDGRTALQETVHDLRRNHRPDVIIVIAHTGLDRDGRSGQENIVRQLAEVPGVDAILFGHTHSEVAEMKLGNVVLLTQPKNWGISLARVDIRLEPKKGGGFQVTRKNSRLIPVTAETTPDPELLRLAAPYHEVTERYLTKVIAQSRVGIDASQSRVRDTAIIDAIHRVQMHYAEADVSFASAFNVRAAIPEGPVTVRQIAALYLYDNELYAIEGNGQMVRDALENAARYFHTCPEPSCGKGPLLNNSVIGYNYDMAQGITYEIDLTKPAGGRIRDLRFRGEPLAPGQKLRIALNNYRAGGSNGYSMFQNAKVLWRSYEDIRELIIRYYSEHELPAAPDENWRIVPNAAAEALRREIRSSSQPVLK